MLRINRDGDDSRRCWLIGHPAGSVREATPAEGERRTVARLQVTNTGAGWTEKTFDDNGNAHVEVSAKGTRNFGSALNAWRWKNSLSRKDPQQQPHPWKGDVVMRFETGADTFEEELIPDAVISLSPVLGGGQSLALEYNVKGGHVEPLRVGKRCSMTVPVQSVAHIQFFGENSAPVTDGTVSVAWDMGASTPPVGTYFVFDFGDPIGESNSLTVRVVNSSDPHVGTEWVDGYHLEYPIHARLAELTTWLNTKGLISASLVTTGARDYILMAFAPTVPPSAITDTFFKVSGFNSSDVLKYEAQNLGTDEVRELVISGALLCVDDLL